MCSSVVLPEPDGPGDDGEAAGVDGRVQSRQDGSLAGLLGEVPQLDRDAAGRGGSDRLGRLGSASGTSSVPSISTELSASLALARDPIPPRRRSSSGTRSQPPRRDDDLLAVRLRPGLLGADPPVADVDDAVGDRGRAGVVADDDRGRALGAGELADQLVDDGCVLRVELAGRLVGEQEPRAVGERGAERDPLLLAAGELVRVGVEPVFETDLAEQLGGRLRRSRGDSPASASRSETSSPAVSSGASACVVALVRVAEPAALR